MSARIKKDLKNLRTEWALAILLTSAPILIASQAGLSPQIFLLGHFAFLAICASWIGAATFGKDLSMGFLSFAFAHLECRRTLWKEKLQTLSIMTLSVYFTSFLTMSLLLETIGPQQHFPPGLNSLSLPLLALVGIIVTLASIGGGLFYSLMFRSYQGAFWLALLTPVFIAVLLTFPIILSKLPEVPSAFWGFIGLVTLVYGLTLSFLGFKKFLTWEDLGPLGGDIWLGLKTGTQPNEKAQPSNRKHKPILGMLRKEICLQQINLVICLSILGLYIVATPFYDPQSSNTETAALLAYFARIVLLFFLPLAIGAVSVSEERRLGISQWQATLPGSLRSQWLTKLLAAYGVTLIATILCPLAIDYLYATFWSKLPILPSVSLTISIAVPLLATTLGFYASSMSGSFLVSLGSSLVTTLVGFGLFLATSKLLNNSVFADGTAIPDLLLATLLLILGLPLTWGLSYHNYRVHVPFTARLPLNSLAWFTTFGMAYLISHQIYGRATDPFASSIPDPKPSAIKVGVRPSIIPGTWTAVLAPDGKLWASKSQLQHNTLKRTDQKMVQIGTDSDWIQAFPSLRNAYLLKQDGRLFSASKWGKNSMDLSPIKDPHPRYAWTKVMAGNGTSIVLGMKEDGSLWKWTENDDGTISEITQYLENHKWHSVARDGHLYIGVATDHTLWGWGFGHASQAKALVNPVIESVSREAETLFPNDAPPNPQSPDVQELLKRHDALLREHGLDISNMEDRSAVSTYIHARLQELNADHTPYPISQDPVWKSVRFSHRLPFNREGMRYVSGLLIATQLNDSTWTTSEAAFTYWDTLPQGPEAKFTQIQSDRIPRLVNYGLHGQKESLTLIDHQGWLREQRLPPNHGLQVRFSTDLEMRAERNDWISFYKDGYSILALTADGFLWHAGPYPIDKEPSNAFALLIPSSRQLRPVFDLINGKPL